MQTGPDDISNREILAALIAFKGGVAGKFDQVDRRFELMQAQMDRRFDRVDQRFDEVDRRLDRLEARVENIEGKRKRRPDRE